MKKFKAKFQSILLVLLLIISCFGGITDVFATSTAKVEFDGNSSVSVGSNITVNLKVTSVTSDQASYNGVVSLSGNLSFDSTYLEYVSATPATSPYAFSINKNNNYKIAGMDFSGSNGIKSSTVIFTFVFKALKAGTTQVTLTNAKLTDSTFQYTTSVVPKNITIGGSTPTTPTTPTKPTTPTNPTTPVTKSSDATLKKLDASGYTLSPAFNKDITSYVVEVPASATTVKLTGEKNNSKASVSGLGNITLTGDETKAEVVVTAEDGTKKTYTVLIKKKADLPSDVPITGDATLKKLDVSGYTLTPTFKPSITSYSMKVKNSITALNVTAIPTDENSKVTITGNSNWKEGVNTIKITVEAPNGSTKVYLVNVTRSPKNEANTTGAVKSSDNKLSNLIIGSPHEISPKFSSDIDTYNITVPYEVDKLDLTPVLSSDKATYKITGNGDFKVGQENVVTIEITAEDGSKRIVTLNVIRNTDSSETDLDDIIIDGYDIEPKFDPKKTDYTIDVPSDVDKLDIKATSKFSNSKIEVIGNENLKEGENTVLIKVTDKNGYVKYYQIKVNKAAKEKKIFGLTYLQFAIIGFIIGLLLLLLLILLLLLRKKKDDKDPVNYQQTPIIDFKPEFNFGSRNGTDDDVVYSGATLNQSSNNESEYRERNMKSVPYEETKELPYIDKENAEEVPYDMYDDIVTKDELIDAIYEGLEEKNPEKLQMLLEQEKLNRKKEEMRRREEERKERD